LLAGGIDAENVVEAVRASGAPAVDVSSGVEDRPGLKNPAKIRTLLKIAAAI
jgi:phosphoribosylanthranilate isomerase